MRRWTAGIVLAPAEIMVLAVGGYYLVSSRSFQLARRLVERTAVRPGSIILLHVRYEGRVASRAAIPRIVAELR